MSSYVNFYIKDIKRDNKFVYFDSYSRSSSIYGVFDEYKGNNVDEKGRCKVLKAEDIDDIQGLLKGRKEAIVNSIKDLEIEKGDIIKMNNPVSEKQHALEELYMEISDEKKELEEIEFSITFYDILWDVSLYGGNRLYAGIEGINPDGSEDNE